MFLQGNVLLAALAGTALAVGPLPLSERATTCKSSYGSGICQNTSTNCNAGVYLPGYCPGAADIQCCIKTPINCETPDGNGICGDISNVCANGSGFYSAGYCPGPNDVQCCVPTPADPPPSDDDGDDGEKDDDNPNGEAVPDADVLAELKADGLDGEFDDDGNLIVTRDLQDRAAAKKTKGERIYAAAAKEVGTKYVWGGGSCSGPTKGGFDCSGLVLYAVCKITGKKLPHGARYQYASSKGAKHPYKDRKIGDAVFWGCNSGRIYHVAIVKNSTHIVAAANKKKGVVVEPMWGKPCPSVVRFG